MSKSNPTPAPAAQESGVIEYTERAFEQDADNAMGTDIIRALIELITNADDAYRRSTGAADGEISVVVYRLTDEPVRVSVGDTATGLTRDGLKSCFGILGGKTSGFHSGEDTRGLLGRGAKDTAAFGSTHFETIRDGVYSEFLLNRNGSWTSPEARPATDADRARLGIPEGKSGLCATVTITKAGVSVPPDDKLAERLCHHAQLRRLTNRRTVSVVTVTSQGRKATTIAEWSAPPRSFSPSMFSR